MLTAGPVALREGLLCDFLARTKPLPLAPRRDGDLRLRAVIDLAGRCDYPIDHSHQVARIAGQIFRQTKEMHGLDENEERLLEYASILHDIGYHIGYSKHHKHAYYFEKLFGVEAVFLARKPARRKTGEPGSPQGRG